MHTKKFLSPYKVITSSILGLVIAGSLLVSPTAFAANTLDAGNQDSNIPAEVTSGRSGTDIRFKTNVGNTYHYTNGKTNPAVRLSETNPADTDAQIQSQRALVNVGDTFVFHDRYELESPDTENGTLEYSLKLFCSTGCEDVSQYLEVSKVSHYWSEKDTDRVLTQEITPSKSVKMENGEIKVSITPFQECNGVQCLANSTISTENNSAGQYGWVAVTLSLKQPVSEKSIVVDGVSSQSYSAFGTANGNSLRVWIGKPSSDQAITSKESVQTTYVEPETEIAPTNSNSSNSSNPALPQTGGEQTKSESSSTSSTTNWILPTVLVAVALAVICFAFYRNAHKKAK